ncbi:unnamed protein product [Effrenium voratum]|nr:unnamed protein product [Effrenium voratum]
MRRRLGLSCLALLACSPAFLAPRAVKEEAPNVDLGKVSIEELLPSLPFESRRNLAERQILEPSPIQALALPHIGSGKHAVLISETGSGKTLAYLLPAVERAREADEEAERTGPSSVLILAPTRELAVQILAEVEDHCQGIIALVTLSARASWYTLMDASVIIATPAELLEAFDQEDAEEVKDLLGRVEVVIVDELDELLPKNKYFGRKLARYQDPGMWPTEGVLKRLMRNNQRESLQVVAASATAYRSSRLRLEKVLKRDRLQRFPIPLPRIDPQRSSAAVLEAAAQAIESQANDEEEEEEEALREEHREQQRYRALPAGIEHFTWKVPLSGSHAAALAAALDMLRPESALVFVCPNAGETVRSVVQDEFSEGRSGKHHTTQNMAAMQAKEFYVTWDGDPATWADYTRKVRLQWEKTPSWKRLTGRAWAVTYELSHEKLSKKNGTKYLLRYLQDRLCRTPVPDAGARLEDLLIRLRRPLGMTMARKMEPKKDLTKAILDKRHERQFKKEKRWLKKKLCVTFMKLNMVEDVQVLPDEVLGWLLLRHQCRTRSPSEPSSEHFEIKKKNYFMWMLIDPLNNNDDAMEELSGEVHWVGDRLPAEVYPQAAEEHLNDEVYWSWDDSGWRGYLQDDYGYWVETEQKDLDDAYAAFEDKARTFAQSKTFQRAKGGARGFYPFGKGKGKKGKQKGNFGKGKGYGGWKGSSSSTSTSTTLGKPSNVLVTESALAVNGYTACGDRNHGFRQCPNRASGSGQSSGKGKNVFWNTSAMNGRIYMITEHEEQKVFVGGTDMMMDDPERPGGVVRETAGFRVLDIGATETVGSLEAIEKLCQLRGPHHAKEIKVIPHGQKSFRFGNNQVQRSEGYILVPQQIGQQWLQLGIFTLDVGQIPIIPHPHRSEDADQWARSWMWQASGWF